MVKLKILKKKPTLLVWLFFGIGVSLFMAGTLQPVNAPMINLLIFSGEVFFGVGIIIGAGLVISRKRKR